MSDPITIPANRLSYLNVEVSEKGFSEFSHGRRTIFIPKGQIQNVEIRFGSRAERPLLQMIFGVLLIGLGLVGLVFVTNGGFTGFRWGIGFIIFGGLGGFCLYEALRKGYYLRVFFSNDTRKLAFNGAANKAELSNFIKVATNLGYSFRDCTIDRNIL